MKNADNVFIKGAKLFDLPLDAVAGFPKVEVCGTESALIENHKGILEYSDNLLSLNLGNSILNIYGTNLVITAMNENGLRMQGSISSLQYDPV